MEVPQYINDTLLRTFGSYINGKPYWRVVWSETRVELAFGKEVQKYAGTSPQFVLEKFFKPEEYDRVHWEAALDENGHPMMGPFPTSGDYEPSYFLGTQISGDRVNNLVALIQAGLERFTTSQRKVALREKYEKIEAERLQQNFAMLIDRIATNPRGELRLAMNSDGDRNIHRERIKRPKDFENAGPLTANDIPLPQKGRVAQFHPTTGGNS